MKRDVIAIISKVASALRLLSELPHLLNSSSPTRNKTEERKARKKNRDGTRADRLQRKLHCVRDDLREWHTRIAKILVRYDNEINTAYRQDLADIMDELKGLQKENDTSLANVEGANVANCGM